MSQNANPLLSTQEKSNCSVLLVDQDNFRRNQLRQQLMHGGYTSITEANDERGTYKRLGERSFTHIIFSPHSLESTPTEFLRRSNNINPGIIPIVCVRRFDADIIFEMLQNGAKGFLTEPVEIGDLEVQLGLATKGTPIPREVLFARDRNEALSALVAESLDSAARELRHQKSLGRELDLDVPAVDSFRRAAKVATTFAQGGIERLLDAFENLMIKRGDGPATRMGRLRQRLQKERNENYGRKKKPSDLISPQD